jgi:hypothetical protein
MNIMKLLLAIFILCSLATVGLPQQEKTPPIDSDVRISKAQPTVYITFVRLGKRKPEHTDESNEGVWLSLHNNTKWSLVLHAYGAGGYTFARGDEEEVGMFYGIEEVSEPKGLAVFTRSQKDKPPETAEQDGERDCSPLYDNWCHVCSTIILPPGKSLLFSLPRESLCEKHKIYLVYNYEWEKREGYAGMDAEPQHRVYFYGRDIPKGTR